MGSGNKKQYLMQKTAVAFAPATVANLACGFDVLGLALEGAGDRVHAAFSDTPGARRLVVHGDDGSLPGSFNQNTAGIAANAFMNAWGKEAGVELELFKGLPLGSGLGSSAASAIAALMAVNVLAGSPFKNHELLSFAIQAEEAVCGSGHADNVAPALMGGITLIRNYHPLEILSLPVPPRLTCAVCVPGLQLNTAKSRSILPEKISLNRATRQWANLGGLVDAFHRSDYPLIGRCLEDYLIEPVRSQLISGFSAVQNAAHAAGALGASISGGGPSIFALCKGMASAKRVAGAMESAFESYQIKSTSIVSRINTAGATAALQEPNEAD